MLKKIKDDLDLQNKEKSQVYFKIKIMGDFGRNIRVKMKKRREIKMITIWDTYMILIHAKKIIISLIKEVLSNSIRSFFRHRGTVTNMIFKTLTLGKH